MVNVTVWNEHVQEGTDEAVREQYPDGIHTTIAEALEDRGHTVRTATLADPEHGLTEDVLADTDVLVWWGHVAHDEVDREIVDRVCEQVYRGMGLIPLHSAHVSKPFKRLLGTPCTLSYRESGERERLWCCEPGHPIAAGLEGPVTLEPTEMYGEPFAVPAPDELVFISWFEGGEVFRSGCCYQRGAGRIFYFRPGHETYPIYHQEVVHQILDNGVRWAAKGGEPIAYPEGPVEPRE